MINIFYGEAGVYGVVSIPKTVREGINVYLSGYLREDNVRFRDHELKFYSRPSLMSKSSESLIEWTPLKKQLGDFFMESDKGKISKKAMIGVLGENGIGKTTFMKLLAGETEPDEGEINEEIRIAYKPQYIEIEKDMPVALFLKKAIKKYSNQLIKPFGIDSLKERMLSELSGGELQRVMIAHTLSKDADVFLFDEPSAYLDVEQRLMTAKTISTIMEIIGKSCVVVDHDLLFLDAISSYLMVFQGKPAKFGKIKGPLEMEEGMGLFLKDLGITFRRDKDSKRPRANKEGSQLDTSQKSKGIYFYS
jgi:ATP-binding cassette subfamily E protein 1